MGFRSAGLSPRAVALIWRTLLTGLLASASLYLAASRLYFTAAFAALITTFFIANLARLIGVIERTAESTLQGLIASESEIGLMRLHPGTPGMSAPDRAAAILGSARARRQSQLEYLQALLDTVAAALLVVAPDGRVRLVNRAARMLAGRPVEFLHEINALGSEAAADLLGQRPGTREIIQLRSGIRVLTSVSQFIEPASAPLRLVSLQQITGELDAVELNAWSDMAQVLAHEMMNSLTPIASLSASLETLVRKASQPDGQRSLSANEEILGALEAIGRRSRGLIEFVERYRAVAELPKPHYQQIRLRELIDDIARLLAPPLTAAGIVLRATVIPEHLSVSADARLLEHALINLLRNSMDSLAESNPAAIEITCVAREGGVQIRVADTGRGIDPQLRDRVFIPFFTTKPGGSGIGLTLTRQIARAHRGQLELYRNEPRGCVFVLFLPTGASA